MFSGLGQIFSPTPLPRQAEHGDAKMALQRHPDEKNRKRSKRENPSWDDQNDDTTVSIESLALFLNNFLKSVTEKPKKSFDSAAHHNEEAEITEETTPTPAQNYAAPNARAAQAYQQTAIKSGDTSQTETNANTTDSKTETHMGQPLGADDIRTIHKILEHLETLKARDIAYLHIEREGTFLQSILSAVKAAL